MACVDWLDFTRAHDAAGVAEKTCQMICYLWFTDTHAQLTASPAFVSFMHKLLETTQVSQSVIVLSLHFIHRLKDRNRCTPAQRGSEFRIAVAGLMMANKFLDDNTYTNKTWSDVSGIDLGEINRMEREFLLGVDFNLYVDKPTYEAWLNLLKGLVMAKDRDLRRARRMHQHPRLPRPLPRQPQPQPSQSYIPRPRSTSPSPLPPIQHRKRTAQDAFSPTTATFSHLPLKVHVPSPIEGGFSKMSLRTPPPPLPAQTLVTPYTLDPTRKHQQPQNLYFYSLSCSPPTEQQPSQEQPPRKARLHYHQPSLSGPSLHDYADMNARHVGVLYDNARPKRTESAYYPSVQSARTSPVAYHHHHHQQQQQPQQIHLPPASSLLPHFSDKAWSRERGRVWEREQAKEEEREREREQDMHSVASSSSSSSCSDDEQDRDEDMDSRSPLSSSPLDAKLSTSESSLRTVVPSYYAQQQPPVHIPAAPFANNGPPGVASYGYGYSYSSSNAPTTTTAYSYPSSSSAPHQPPSSHHHHQYTANTTTNTPVYSHSQPQSRHQVQPSYSQSQPPPPPQTSSSSSYHSHPHSHSSYHTTHGGYTTAPSSSSFAPSQIPSVYTSHTQLPRLTTSTSMGSGTGARASYVPVPTTKAYTAYPHQSHSHSHSQHHGHGQGHGHHNTPPLSAISATSSTSSSSSNDRQGVYHSSPGYTYPAPAPVPAPAPSSSSSLPTPPSSVPTLPAVISVYYPPPLPAQQAPVTIQSVPVTSGAGSGATTHGHVGYVKHSHSHSQSHSHTGYLTPPLSQSTTTATMTGPTLPPIQAQFPEYQLKGQVQRWGV